jgi:hypothetical protein
MELNLKIPTMCPVQSTFYHFNNRDESQIDYFVESVGMVEKYITDGQLSVGNILLNLVLAITFLNVHSIRLWICPSMGI